MSHHINLINLKFLMFLFFISKQLISTVCGLWLFLSLTFALVLFHDLNHKKSMNTP